MYYRRITTGGKTFWPSISFGVALAGALSAFARSLICRVISPTYRVETPCMGSLNGKLLLNTTYDEAPVGIPYVHYHTGDFFLWGVYIVGDMPSVVGRG